MFHGTGNELVNWIDCREYEAIELVHHSPRISKACTSIETHTTFPISIEHTLRSNVMCKRRKDINSFVILSQAVRTEHWEHILLTFSLGNRTHVCCCFQSNAHAHKHALVQTCVFSTISLGHIHIVWTTTDHITWNFNYDGNVFLPKIEIFFHVSTRTHRFHPKTRIPFFVECRVVARCSARVFTTHICAHAIIMCACANTRFALVRSFGRSFIQSFIHWSVFISSNHLFIYCQVNFKRCPVSISLKGNDIFVYVHIHYT